MVILVEVDARSCRRLLTVLSDEDEEGASAETLLTTDDTIERSTVTACQPQYPRRHTPWVDR